MLYQSLVKLLCTGCRLPARVAVDPERLALLEGRFGLDVDRMYVRKRNPLGRFGPICPICSGSGEIGRTAIAELIIPDRRFLDLIRERNVNAAMDHYRSQRVSHFDDLDTRGKTFVEHALAKAANGFICTNEVFDAVEDLFSYEIRPIALPRSYSTSGGLGTPAAAKDS